MSKFKFLIAALSSVCIAGSFVSASTAASGCLYNKLKSNSAGTDSAAGVDLSGFKGKSAAGIAGIAGIASLSGLGLFYYRRREAELAAMSFDLNDDINDGVKLHPEAPGGELEIEDTGATSPAESSEKEPVLTK